MSPTNRQCIVERREEEAQQTRVKAMLRWLRTMPDPYVLQDLKTLRRGREWRD